MPFLKSAAFYAAGFIAAAAALFVLIGAGRSPKDGLAENLAMAGYMLAVTAIPAAIGFGLVMSLSRSWRNLPARTLALASFAAGVLGELFQLTGLAFAAAFYAIPRLGAFTVPLQLVFPGLLLGGIALGVARMLRPRASITPEMNTP